MTVGQKHILVTGASSGLGRHIAATLINSGAKVTILGRDERKLLESFPDHVEVLQVAPPYDIFDIRNAVRAAAKDYGPINGMVHCAGAEVTVPLRMMRPDHFDLAMDAMVIASGLLAAAATPNVMDKSGASIVLMSSIAASRGTPSMSAYSAGKAAIEALARSAAVELAPRRVRVNCVAAGAFKSPMHLRVTELMSEGTLADYESMHPLGFGEIEDVADACLFLLRSRWITGTTLVVDGGALA
jgi:NAD(P)-dependent dehydrogenase (short-subunit alcohol dehydrogenase family)